MAEKLRSITRQIPSSLLLKSGAVAALWLVGKAAWSIGFGLPFWAYAALAAYLYFVPVFRPGYFLPHFLLFALFSFLLPANLLSALALGTAFLLLLGIKDLVFVNREAAYEFLILLLLFLAAWSAYFYVGNWSGAGVLLLLPSIGAVYAFLTAELPFHDPPRMREKTAISILGGLLTAEASFAILFLPMDYLYQAALLMLFMTFLVFMELRLKKGGVSFREMLSLSAPFAILAAFILILNSWRV